MYKTGSENFSTICKLVVDGIIILPLSISIPPSQVVHLLVEYEGEKSLKCLTKSSTQKTNSAMTYPTAAPHMTSFLAMIGESLASSWFQVKLWEDLKFREAKETTTLLELEKKWLKVFRFNYYKCPLCKFKTESNIVLEMHRLLPHLYNKKYFCAICLKTQQLSKIGSHYKKCHKCVCGEVLVVDKRYFCMKCDKCFNSKFKAKAHENECKRIRLLMALEDGELYINKCLWKKTTKITTVACQGQYQNGQQFQIAQRRGDFNIRKPTVLMEQTSNEQNLYKKVLKRNQIFEKNEYLNEKRIKMIEHVTEMRPKTIESLKKNLEIQNGSLQRQPSLLSFVPLMSYEEMKHRECAAKQLQKKIVDTMVCQARMVSQNNLTNDATNQKKAAVLTMHRAGQQRENKSSFPH